MRQVAVVVKQAGGDDMFGFTKLPGERGALKSVLAFGESMRLAESFALIWKTTRISISVSVFLFRNRLTLLNVSTVTIR